jgi:Uma2 family endonuclease
MVETPHGSTIGAGKLTYEDLVNTPDDGKRYEILDGDLFVTPSPVTNHQRVSRDLGFFLHTHVKERSLGEVFYAPIDVILDKHTIAVPDLVYVSAARAHLVQKHGIVGAPDLLVEILSPSTKHRDRGVKAKLYARFGVDEYWIVDPNERVLTIYSRREGTYVEVARHAGATVVRTSLLPDLALDLSEVWA